MSSPSELLTFYRRFAANATIRTRVVAPSSNRSFFLSSRLGKDPGQQDEHLVDRQKKDTLDVQAENSKKGIESKEAGGGGSATSGKDHRSSAKKTKEEFPEAPDTVIGMQDERGGKSH